MQPRITILTLGVDDLEAAVRFYRDGLGLPTEGIIGTEFEHGAVAFFELAGGIRLGLWPRESIAADTGLAVTPPSATELTIAHNVGSREEVDAVMAQAAAAGARIVKPAADTFYGGYAGFEAASLDEVAEAAGYTKGAIYSNFASKTDLVLALIERRIGQQAEGAAAALEGMTLEQGLQALDDQAARGGGIDRDWIVLVVEFWLRAMRDERARAAMAEQYERARTLTASMLARKFAEAREEPPLPPRELAIVVEALGLGVALQALLDPKTISIGLQAKAVELLLGAGRTSDGVRPGRNPDGSGETKS